MKLQRAALKLAKNTLQGYNHLTSTWVTLPFKCQFANSGRWIGRSEDFYNRRVLLTPEPVPETYQVIRIGSESAEYLLFGNAPHGQANISHNVAYMFEYNALNVEVEYAQLIELTSTPSASGISGIKTETVLGSFPVAVSRYASLSNTVAKNVTQSRCDVYIPTYAGAKTEHTLRLAGESYDIVESYLELNLRHLNCNKR